MSLFCTDSEIAGINDFKKDANYSNLYWGMRNRVNAYCNSPGLNSGDHNTEWWHNISEILSEAAFIYRIEGGEVLGSWLRSSTMEVIRRSDHDWVGPFFRDHESVPLKGHLETTHLIIGVAMVLDLCPDIFSSEEEAEIRKRLQFGLQLCRNWVDGNNGLANWTCILVAGAAVASALLGDNEGFDYVYKKYQVCLQAFQEDGSYGESLQYSNYACFGLMYIYESLLRSGYKTSDELKGQSYVKVIDWIAQSYLYKKPLSGWGAYPLPRSVNFNDSAAIFGGDPDLLMHISARCKIDDKKRAGLAKWMFDELYVQYPAQGPFDRNSFGFINRYSILSMVFYPQVRDSVSPLEYGLADTVTFDNGNCIARDRWEDNRTVVAFSGGSDKLHCSGHLHEDLNSIILVHNQERLLADPGHTCYRSLIHEFDTATYSHNTCTFKIKDKPDILRQHLCKRRHYNEDGVVGAPVSRNSKQLGSCRIDNVSMFAADAAEAYGQPLTKFERISLLCGTHVVFVIDRIEATEEINPVWNWLLNNRDGELEYKSLYSDRIVARRGNAGMKIFHIGKSHLAGPVYGHIHDAYHPLPQQKGEGAPGSGILFRFNNSQSGLSHERVHAIALDTYGLIPDWHMSVENGKEITVNNQSKGWTLQQEGDGYVLMNCHDKQRYSLVFADGKWEMAKM